MATLTVRETEVVDLAAKVFTTRATALEMGIGFETAKERRATAMRKLGVDSIAVAATSLLFPEGLK